MEKAPKTISLPKPQTSGNMPLEEAITRRHSQREFRETAPAEAALSQLLWSLQGIRDAAGSRTVPSAGALYPLEIYVALQDGLYHYDPAQHQLTCKDNADLRSALCKASHNQESISQAPFVFVIAVVYERIASRYGAKRGERYTILECGHAAQNLSLQAVALGLGSVLIGAFIDAQVSEVLHLPSSQQPIYLIPVGCGAS